MLETDPHPPLRSYRPRAVLHAVRAMVGVALLNLVGLIVYLVFIDDVRRLLRDATPPPSDGAVDTAVRITVIGYVLFAVAFPLLTRQVTLGRNWARIATWILTGVGIVTTLQRLSIHQPSPSRVLDVLALVLDVAVAALLAARPSGRWFSGA